MNRIRVVLVTAAVVLVLGWVGWTALRPSEPQPPTVRTLQAPQLRTLQLHARSDPADPKHLRNPFPQLRLMPRRATAAFSPTATPAAQEPLKLDSPTATVQTQLQVLSHGTDDEFRQTFLPEVRSQLTPGTIETCRQRVQQLPVKPDWEMAENTKDAEGRETKKVSMFGKSMTGFHDVNGQWLADGVWCDPPGYP